MGHAAVLVARSGACASGCSTGSTRKLPAAGNGARHEQHRSAIEARQVRERARSTERQHANTHQLFFKLCWLTTRCQRRPRRERGRDVLPPPAGASDRVGRRGVKQAQLQGNTREATTITVAFSMDRGALDMLVQIVHAAKTDAVLREQPWPEHTHHVTSENGWAIATTILQLTAALDDVVKPRTSTWPASTHRHRHASDITSLRAVLHPAA